MTPTSNPWGPCSYVLTWGAGELTQGSQVFSTMEAVRGFLEWETDMPAAEIDSFIAFAEADPLCTSRVGDDDTDPIAGTQFDCAWITLHTVQTAVPVREQELDPNAQDKTMCRFTDKGKP